MRGWQDRLPAKLLVAAVLLAGLWLGTVAILAPVLDRARERDVEHDGSTAVAATIAAELRDQLDRVRTTADDLAGALAPELARQTPDLPRLTAMVLAPGRPASVTELMAFDAAGQPLVGEFPDLSVTARDALAGFATDSAAGRFLPAVDGIAYARRIAAADGRVVGVVVANLDLTVLHRLADVLASEQLAWLGLQTPAGRLLFNAGIAQVDRDSALAGAAWVFDGELEVRLLRRPPPPLARRRLLDLAEIGLALPAMALLVIVCLMLRGRVAAGATRLSAREVRLSAVAGSFAGLSRLRDPLEVATRAEVLTRALLDCRGARVSLGANAIEISGPGRLSVPLIGVSGDRLGRLQVRHAGSRQFTDADRLALDLVAEIVAATLENAGLLADAVRARAEVDLILGTISDGMYVLDRDWCVRYVNSAGLRYMQRSREEMLGAVIWDLFEGTRETAFGQRVEYAMRTSEDADFTGYFAPLNAWYEMRCFPFAHGLTVYFRDITAQRETEEKLRQSQKLEALGQLTGGIAHDVNNLLTVILGNFELLAMNAEERGAQGGADLPLAEAGLRAGESASQLMHRLLAFARRQPLSPRVVDVARLLDSLEPLLRRTLGEPIALRIVAQEGLWPALIDPAELENAIINLALNASDAMPSGGRLTIEAANVQIDRVYAAVAGLDRTGDFIMLSVTDSGIGMTRDIAAQAFDPFFTTKQAGKGTGLGLSMVYGFAKQSGGHVMIDSEPGQGTIIRAYLPRTTRVESSPEPVTDREAERGSETILLVEDNNLVRAHTEAMVVGLGYQVIAARDGPEALALLGDGLRPDLLLTDVVLPGGMTGRDVADAAGRMVPGLRVLFTSGYSGNVLMEEGRVGAGVALIGKPFRRTELAARIRAQIDGAPWASLRGREGSLSSRTL